MAKRHKWKWSDAYKIGTCQKCGCKIKRKTIPMGGNWDFLMREFFIHRDGRELLLGKGVRMPPCEPMED